LHKHAPCRVRSAFVWTGGRGCRRPAGEQVDGFV
jgi:hypothetical protein